MTESCNGGKTTDVDLQLCSDFDKFLSQQQDQLYSYTIVRLPGCVLEDFFIFPTGKFLTHHDVVLQNI
jgi:hypothetical protein